MQERLQHSIVYAENQVTAAMGEQEKLAYVPDVEIISPDQASRNKDSKHKREAGHHNGHQNIDKIDQAIDGLASGQYGSLREASRNMGFNPVWLTSVKMARPDIAQRIDQACATPAFQAIYEVGQAERMAELKKHAVAAIRKREHPNIDKIDQAIDGLASGQYGSLQESSQALGFHKSWLSVIRRSNPIIAERLGEACATPACQARRQDNLRRGANLKKGARNSTWNQNIDKIDQAIDGLASGQYDSLRTASIAMGFASRWLWTTGQTRLDIAQRIDQACATPAFQKANRVQKAKRAKSRGESLKSLNQRRQAKSQEQISQAIAGLANGQYENMRQASLAQEFAPNWLYERQLTQPKVAERLLAINAKSNSREFLAQRKSLDQTARRPKAIVDQSNTAPKTNKVANKKSRTVSGKSQARPRIETGQPAKDIDKSLASIEQPENESTTGKPLPLSVLIPGLNSMSLNRQISRIIDFWESDIGVDDVMFEFEAAGIHHANPDTIREQVASILKRKSRFASKRF